ncbi:MAG: hypothetical protein WBA74_27820, partial [Cyclobacteriaceae bacterium]
VPGKYLPQDPLLKPYQSLKSEQVTGFLKFTITKPIEGFGTLLYPKAISRVTMENGQLMILKSKKPTNTTKYKTIPNKPFIPQVNSMTIAYLSDDSVYGVSGKSNNWQWYHLVYEGIEQVEIENHNIPFVKEYRENSYAYLGFDILNADQELNILVSVVGGETQELTDNPPPVTYEVYSNDDWQDIPVYGDSTVGLQNIGIIKLKLPSNLSPASAFGDQLAWIRIGSSTTKDILIDYLADNGLKAKRSMDGEVTTVTDIKKGTISKLQTPNDQVGDIEQPAVSFGGVSVASEQQFIFNTAMRLDHKNRMVTTENIDKILLSAIPQLYAVSALPMVYLDTEQSDVVKVLLISYQDQNSQSPFRPVTSPIIMRNALDLIDQKATDNMIYEVAVPEFVALEITCLFTTSEQSNALGIIALLNRELKQFLSPWILNNQIEAAKQVSRNAIYQFIKSRNYVVFIKYLSCRLIKSDEESSAAIDQFKIGSNVIVDNQIDIPENAINVSDDDDLLSVSPEELIVTADQHQLSVITAEGVISAGETNRVGELIISN